MPVRIALPKAFDRISFSRQFLIASTVCLVAGMAVIGTWLGHQIEQSVLNRAAAIAAVYVESILAAQLQGWPQVGLVTPATHDVLDRVFIQGPLKRKVVRFKLWGADGHIIYSSDHAQLGNRYPVGKLLTAAFRGEVQARISDLTDDDNPSERKRWSELLEVYVPVRLSDRGEVLVVAEFYHSVENLRHDIDQAQQQSWTLVAITTLSVYLALLGFVRRASDTIVDQQRDLREQLRRLSASLAENEVMREQLREAGAQTTTLNEQFLHRIAADLHDGPAQELSFALLRFDDLIQACGNCRDKADGAPAELETVRRAVRSALDDLRGIAAGLGIPGIADLSLADTLRRAVRDVERKTSRQVEAHIDAALGEAPIATKITAYRLLQESLTNSWRHAPDHPARVRVRRDGDMVDIEVVTPGAGFDTATAAASGRLGIAFMRERVRLLGGVFEIDSARDRGTRIHARLSITPKELHHG